MPRRESGYFLCEKTHYYIIILVCDDFFVQKHMIFATFLLSSPMILITQL